MRTCKHCEKFLECLKKGDVVINVRGGEHICQSFILKLPDRDGIVEVLRGDGDRWVTALFYRNGKRPVFAQFGSEIKDVTVWREKKGINNNNFIPYNEIFK